MAVETADVPYVLTPASGDSTSQVAGDDVSRLSLAANLWSELGFRTHNKEVRVCVCVCVCVRVSLREWRCFEEKEGNSQGLPGNVWSSACNTARGQSTARAAGSHGSGTSYT